MPIKVLTNTVVQQCVCVCLFVAGISAVIWFDEREKLPSETTLRAGCLIEVPIQTSSSLTVHA